MFAQSNKVCPTKITSHKVIMNVPKVKQMANWHKQQANLATYHKCQKNLDNNWYIGIKPASCKYSPFSSSICETIIYFFAMA